MDTDIIICTENGHLEPQAKLLVYSIRKYGGIISDSKIYSYKPRRGRKLHRSTLDFFEKFEVEYIDEALNKKYKNYALANKPIVCSHRERNTNADVIIFLDTDSFFLNSPEVIKDIKIGEVMMRPVDRKHVSAGPGFSGKEGEYWKGLYKKLGVQRQRHVRTTIDNQEVLEYYNSGLIISVPSNNLFQHWESNFERIMLLGLKPKHGVRYVEQSVLSATISALDFNVKALGSQYNCPAHRIKNCKNPEYIIANYGDLIHVHYHNCFQNESGVNTLYNDFEKFKKGRDMNKKVVEFGVLQKKEKDNSFLRKVKDFLKRYLMSA